METFQQTQPADLAPRMTTNFLPRDMRSDPTEFLPPSAATKLIAIRQRAADLHAQIPDFDQLREAQLSVNAHQQRIKDLTAHRSEGGFGLARDALQTVTEQRLLDRAKSELERLNSLRETRTARWSAAGALERACVDWLAHGVPGNCQLIEGAPVITEPLKKGQSTTDAVEKCRRRLSERAADLHRVRSSPHTSQEAKAAAREQINQLADAAEPDVSSVVKLLEPIRFTTTRTRSLAPSLDPNLAPAIVHSEFPDAIGLVAFMFREELIAKCESLIDQECAGSSEALSEKQRQEREVEISAEMRAIETAEVALIWAAEARGEVVDFRADTTPALVLGLELETRPRPTALPGTSPSLIVQFLEPR